jgi:hypothetical protein
MASGSIAYGLVRRDPNTRNAGAIIARRPDKFARIDVEPPLGGRDAPKFEELECPTHAARRPQPV